MWSAQHTGPKDQSWISRPGSSETRTHIPGKLMTFKDQQQLFMPPREPVFPARAHQYGPKIPGTSSSPLHCPRLCLWGCISSSYPGSPPPPLLGGKFLSKENSSPCRENPFILMIAHPSKRIVFVSYNQGCLFFPNSFASSNRLVISSVFAL